MAEITSCVIGLIFLIVYVVQDCTCAFYTDGSDELLTYFHIPCLMDVDCPYGYEADVEGHPICMCHDPCKYVYCLEGTKCVIHVPKTCDWQNCKPKADCQDISTKRRRKIKLFPMMPQSDDASASRSVASPNPMCLLALTEDAKDCKNSKVRKRWYYDPESGKCRKFRGCRTGGNNFGRKKRCKRKCIKKRRFPKRRMRRMRKGKRRAKQ